MTLVYIVFAALDTIVYGLVSNILRLIDDLAHYNFFSLESLGDLHQKVYIVLGVLMLFKLVISAIQYLVNPDSFDDKSAGMAALLKRMVISVVLITVMPLVFMFGLEVQKTIITSMPGMIFGQNVANMEDIGEQIAVSTWSGFIQPKDDGDNLPDFKKVGDIYGTAVLGCSLNPLKGAFWNAEKCTYTYWWGLSTVVGVFLVYVLASMAIDVGIRTIKLGIIQLLAPIPLANYITDEKKLSNFTKTTLTVYADLFIRLGIIYFCMYFLSVVLGDFLTTTGYPEEMAKQLSGELTILRVFFIKLFIIISILLFAKNAPKFIIELLGLPDNGGNIGEMFKRAGGLFGTTLGGLKTIRSNYTTQKERYMSKHPNDPNASRGKKLANALKASGAGLLSAGAGFGSATGRGLWMTGQGKGFNDVRRNSFKDAIAARDKRIDKNDNIIRTDVDEFLKDENGNYKLDKNGQKIRNPEYYTRADYRRDIRRERLGIPSDTAFMKVRYDTMEQTGKAAADAKSHGVSKSNETPGRYQIGLDLSRDSNGDFKDKNAAIVYDALGFDSLSMEQVRNFYAMAKNGNEVENKKGAKVKLNQSQIDALGDLVQTIEKRTSYMKEAELMGTGDPAAVPNVEKLKMLVSNNKNMYNDPSIMASISSKFSKYGIPVASVQDIMEQLNILGSDLQNKQPKEPIYEGVPKPEMPTRPQQPIFTLQMPTRPDVPLAPAQNASEYDKSQYAASFEQYKIDLANYNQQMQEYQSGRAKYDSEMIEYKAKDSAYQHEMDNYNAAMAQYIADKDAFDAKKDVYDREQAAWLDEVNKRADILNAVKDAYEEVTKTEYANAQFADTRAQKAQKAVNNNDKNGK